MGKKKKKINKDDLKSLSTGLVNRTFPSLFANKLVGVQPMSAPSNTAFFMRNYYSMDKYTIQLSEFFNGKVVQYELTKDSFRFYLQEKQITLFEVGSNEPEEVIQNKVDNFIRVTKMDMLIL